MKRCSDGRRVLPAGDTAFVVEFGDRIDAAINEKVLLLNRALKEKKLPGVTETVPTYRSLLVHYDPSKLSFRRLFRLLERLSAERKPGAGAERRTVTIPVCYGGSFGEDLPDVAAHAGITEEEVIALHTSAVYPVYMLGFLPGFPYLGGMDPRLAAPRLQTPRTRIPAGSVGIGGSQTGVYPQDSPGGWRLLGRTPLKLYDPDRPQPFLCEAGDLVKFEPITPEEYERLKLGEALSPRSAAAGAEKHEAAAAGEFRVVRPGLQTSVQDAGRFGWQDHGIPEAGAADTLSMRLANLLVGNEPDAAVLEAAILGPTLRFEAPAFAALTGADMEAKRNGEPVERYEVIELQAGDTLSLGYAKSGCRAYLAISGGLVLPQVLGSLSTCFKPAMGGFQGRALQTGDRIGYGAAVPGRSGRWLPEEERPAVGLRDAAGIPVLRLVAGPQAEAFTERGLRTLERSVYTLTQESNRMACRLSGPAVEFVSGGDIVSDGIVNGSVQISSAGLPMIMLADHQTTGGYAKAGTVISADLPVIAQCRPGDRVRFAFVTQAEAQRLAQKQRRALRRAERFLRG